VTYHYPTWTALKDTVEDPGGDLRAVEAQEAEVKVETDRPLTAGRFGARRRVPVRSARRCGAGSMAKDGVYHIATPERGDMVRLSNDYFIEVQRQLHPACASCDRVVMPR